MRLSEFLHLLRREIATAEINDALDEFLIDDLEIDNVELSVGVGLEKLDTGETVISVLKKDDKNAIGKVKVELSQWEPEDLGFEDDDLDEFDDELDPSDEKFLSFLNKLGSDEEKKEEK